jgi:hypothetical protein
MAIPLAVMLNDLDHRSTTPPAAAVAPTGAAHHAPSSRPPIGIRTDFADFDGMQGAGDRHDERVTGRAPGSGERGSGDGRTRRRGPSVGCWNRGQGHESGAYRDGCANEGRPEYRA